VAAARGRLPAAQAVAAVLAAYAARGTLRLLAPAEPATAQQAFRWFRDREFRLGVDARARVLRLHGVLDAVPPRSAMDRSLRAWLRDRHAPGVPRHRRIDPGRLRATWRNRGGTMSLELALANDDWQGATRQLVHLLNEVYLDVLPRPAYHEWLVEAFGLDPDNPRWP
jgi:hypothetical protein